jgi:uncharacterized membrane protein YedE/YeeE
MRVNLVALFFGVTFGFAFSAAGFNQYDIVHRTLLLQYWDPWLVFASAIGTALPLLWLLEARGWHTPLGGRLTPKRWEINRQRVLGGAVFGVGWAVTGACPGTVSTMVVAGSVLGIVPLAGILAGIVLRDATAERTAKQTIERPAGEEVALAR